ncbi:hypothetical protein PIB30_101349, partial [Stylosanthes scabra]|nr:hypothetical protein [Stylosanthes scabra]
YSRLGKIGASKMPNEGCHEKGYVGSVMHEGGLRGKRKMWARKTTLCHAENVALSWVMERDQVRTRLEGQDVMLGMMWNLKQG